VAITRARCCLRVFSTLTHDQIDLSRTSAIGARHLREFLRRAAEAGSSTATPVERKPAGALEQEVAEALREPRPHRSRGRGMRRLPGNLAVVHPERQGEYVLGVECDGVHYRSAAKRSGPRPAARRGPPGTRLAAAPGLVTRLGEDERAK